MLFGYASGAQAVLTCTLRAKSPTRGTIVGTDARIEIEGDFYAPNAFTLIPRDGERPSEKDLIDHVAGELAPHKRPREIRFLDELPRNAMGKVVKQKLSQG